MKTFFLFILFIFCLMSCSKKTGQPSSQAVSPAIESEFINYDNPSAQGFDQQGSDLLATILADKIMYAMGGRKAWDQTRYLSWNFFGKRKHWWDKQEGNVRIEDPNEQLIILMNIYSKEGNVQKSGRIMTNKDSISQYLEKGYYYWVNDSYWLIMPFKLKDTGVTLKYIREDTTQKGDRSDVLQLTFKDTGVTPQNRYEVWVDVESRLIKQWAYFKDENQATPQIITSWEEYKTYGKISLSGVRNNYQSTDVISYALTDISVEKHPPQLFTEF